MANLDYQVSDPALLSRGGAPRPAPRSAATPPTAEATSAAPRFIARTRGAVLALPPLVLLSGFSVLSLAAQQDARQFHLLPAPVAGTLEGETAANYTASPDWHTVPGALPSGALPSGTLPPGALPGTGAPGMPLPGTPSAPGAMPGAPRVPSPIASLPPAPGGPRHFGGMTHVPPGALPPGALPPGALPPFAPGQPANPAAAAFARGVRAQQNKRYAEAIAAYREVLRHDPQALPARVNLSILYLQTNQPEKALPQLREAAKLDPKNPAFPGQMAETMLALKRPREAVAPLRRVLELAPDNRMARVALAQALTDTNQSAPAYAEWTRLANSDPQDGQAAYFAGAVALDKLKRPAEAEKWLRRAWQADDWKKNEARHYPGNPRVPLLLADLLTEQKKTAEAARVLAAGAAQFPAVVELQTRLADARWEQGDKDGAVQALKTALQQTPSTQTRDAAQLRVALGRAYALQQQWPAAIGELKRATKLLPKDVESRVLLGESLLRAERPKEAVAPLRQALKLDGRNRGARLLLASAYTEDGQLDAAKREYSTYLAAHSKDADALADYAALLEKQGAVAEAATTWQKVRELAPHNALPTLQRARLLRKLQRDGDALELYRALLAETPHDPNALIGAAEIEAKNGDPKKALEYWKQVVAARPDYDAAYAALLETAVSAGQLHATAGFLKGQLEKSPDRRAAYDAVLEKYSVVGQKEQGRAWVQEFAKRYPQVEAPRLALAQFDRKGSPDKGETPPLAKATPQPTLPAQLSDAFSAEQPGTLLTAPGGDLRATPGDKPGETEPDSAAPAPTATPAGAAGQAHAGQVYNAPAWDDAHGGAALPSISAPLQIAPRYEAPRLTLTAAVTNPQLYLKR